ncbi:hypothetical protein [Olivibacter sitiensis]|uniref:hypothetical protein n=1 Tax=Olivibacter sitiensis TaxID=376470 RepID=UPI001B7F9108|nr:hypothetical protein [Olivibacter sitiensis]
MAINNEGYLEALNNLIDKSGVTKDTYSPTEAQTEMLMMSEQDIKHGLLFSQEKLDEEDLKWLDQL